jgi:hypothetical protein
MGTSAPGRTEHRPAPLARRPAKALPARGTRTLSALAATLRPALFVLGPLAAGSFFLTITLALAESAHGACVSLLSLVVMGMTIVVLFLFLALDRPRRRVRAWRGPLGLPANYLGTMRTRSNALNPRALVGFKRAELELVEHDGVLRVVFVGVGHKERYTASATSRCLAKDRPGHDELAMADCTCGFYAYSSRDAAQDHPQGGALSFLVEVRGSGAVVEHEHGWRASRQDVTAVHMPLCTRCLRVGTHARARAAALTRRGTLEVLCTQHASTCPQERRFSSKELADLFLSAPSAPALEVLFGGGDLEEPVEEASSTARYRVKAALY